VHRARGLRLRLDTKASARHSANRAIRGMKLHADVFVPKRAGQRGTRPALRAAAVVDAAAFFRHAEANQA
jgi:hypothetical protein